MKDSSRTNPRIPRVEIGTPYRENDFSTTRRHADTAAARERRALPEAGRTRLTFGPTRSEHRHHNCRLSKLGKLRPNHYAKPGYTTGAGPKFSSAY